MQIVHQELHHKVIELKDQVAQSERRCRELQTIHQTKEEAYEERIRILEEQLQATQKVLKITEANLKTEKDKIKDMQKEFINFKSIPGYEMYHLCLDHNHIVMEKTPILLQYLNSKLFD